MNTLEEFENDVQEVLNHLYHPLHEPPESLWKVLSVPRSEGIGALRQALIRAIDDLKPPPPAPPDAPSARFHLLLFYRYVQGLTQEATAEKLGLDTRYLRKQQQKAVRALARMLWEASQRGPAVSAETDQPGAGTGEWAAQVQRELVSLMQKVPGAAANVAATLHDAIDLGAALTRERGIRLDLRADLPLPKGEGVGVTPPDLQAVIHPSALRQMLLAGIAALGQGMDGGEILFGASLVDRSVCIEMSARPASFVDPPDLSIIQQIAAAHHGSASWSAVGDVAVLRIDLPAVAPPPRARVLVIEDNADLVSFYRAYVEGMGYELLHAADGRSALEMARTENPDVIVLDIMLPDLDLDGWKLLVQLHGDPATRTIPVVVCSVVREWELAMALGAAVCVPKPVARHDFIAALQQALKS